MTWTFLSLFLVVPLGAIFQKRANSKVKFIKNPRLGILNLAREGAEATARCDLASLSPLFCEVSRSESVPPQCDVLMIYCAVCPDGSIANTSRAFREIVQESGAAVVVVATEHEVGAYIKAAPVGMLGRTNLVMTLRRNNTFPEFFKRLFSAMRHGIPLPGAWNEVSRSFVEQEQDCPPEMIYSNETAPIAFQ